MMTTHTHDRIIQGDFSSENSTYWEEALEGELRAHWTLCELPLHR